MTKESVADTTDESQVDPDTEMTVVTQETQDIEANNIVKNHIIAGMTVGLVPIPLFDLAALVATQVNMLRSLSEHYDVPFDEGNSKLLITSLIGGSWPVLSVVGLSSVTKLIPGVGTLAGGASLSLSAGGTTYAVGQTFIMHYETGGTLENFDAKQSQAFFKREFAKGKTLVQEIRNEFKSSKTTTPKDNKTEQSKPAQEKEAVSA